MTMEAKPRKVRILNTKLLPIAALLLVVLALLFLAGPLIRPVQRTGVFIPQGSGQVVTQNGTSAGGAGNQFFVSGGTGGTATGGTTPRRVTIGGGALGGRSGVLILFVLLLAALAAAVGMLFTKNWGRVLAIIMGILYALLGLISLLPLLFIRIIGTPNPVTLVLGAIHLLLAIAVIVLASIPAKQEMVPVLPATPPAADS